MRTRVEDLNFLRQSSWARSIISTSSKSMRPNLLSITYTTGAKSDGRPSSITSIWCDEGIWSPLEASASTIVRTLNRSTWIVELSKIKARSSTHTCLLLKVVEQTIPKLMRMQASKNTRKNLVRQCRLQPHKQHLILLKPTRICRINGIGDASFIINKLRWDFRAHDELR